MLIQFKYADTITLFELNYANFKNRDCSEFEFEFSGIGKLFENHRVTLNKHLHSR